jgi:hypothetical protein
MIQRKLILSSAIAAIVTAGFAINPASSFADEPVTTEKSAEKPGAHKKHCSCKEKGCTGTKCAAKSKDGCNDKHGCHEKAEKKEKGSTEPTPEAPHDVPHEAGHHE